MTNPQNKIDWRDAYVADPATGCWEWQHSVDRYGYGKWRDTTAYRVVYEEVVGPIPEGLHLDHLCRNPRCVNPDHLEAVTARENWWRGRSPTRDNFDKTHCPRGHPYDEANTYFGKRGRFCRACNRAAVARYNLRKKRAL